MDNSNALSFDFIIVGAGSAGSVMANKLSEGGHYSVLLLEQGKPDNSLLLTMPKGFGAVLAGNDYVSRYSVTRPDNEANNEVWLRGKTLGGSSSVNGMLWVRPQPEGFSALTKAGGEQWSWPQMTLYFDALDGADGIMPITLHDKQHQITDAFVESACVTGLERHHQIADMGKLGAGYLHFNIDQQGKRRSAASAFLKPAKQRSNLHIETGVQVDKVLFDKKRASSVLCRRKGKAITYSAKREVILCAGALESPQILQRSGVGPAALLNDLAISVVHENNCVGANLREHLLLGLSFEVKSWADTENRQYSGLPLIKNVLRYLITRKGPMAESPCHAAAFIRSNQQLDAPDIQLMLNPYSRDGDSFSDSPGVSIVGYPMYPKSTGEVCISSPELGAAPLIKPNYLSEPYDQQASVAATRYIRKLAAQLPLASMLIKEMPATAAAQTDDEIIELYRRNGMPGFHATGSCAMGGNSDSSVVDGDARVHGVDSLRVVDCSIYPEMLSGVTNASIMAVAMRAADLIIEQNNQ